MPTDYALYLRKSRADLEAEAHGEEAIAEPNEPVRRKERRCQFECVSQHGRNQPSPTFHVRP